MLKVISELIGVDSTIKLCQSMGGARLYIPNEITELHPLSVLLGSDKAGVLCHHLAGELLDLPSKSSYRAVRDHCIRNDYKSGQRMGEIASKYGLSRRHVLTIIHRQNENNNNGETYERSL